MPVEVASVSTVVASEDHQRVLGESEVIQRFEYLANGPVQLLNHVAIRSRLACPLEAGIRPVRLPFDVTRPDMGLSRCVIEEERLLLFSETFQLWH